MYASSYKTRTVSYEYVAVTMCVLSTCMYASSLSKSKHIRVLYEDAYIHSTHSDSNIFILCVEYKYVCMFVKYMYVCMFMLSTCMYASSYEYIVTATYSQQDYTYMFIATR